MQLRKNSQTIADQAAVATDFSGVQGAGFEPAKHSAADLEPAPFDHSGTPAQ